MIASQIRCLSTHCLSVTALLLAACSHAAAQETTTPATETLPRPVVAANTAENGALNALLFEVRLLRLALQNVNTGSKRIQLAAERIRLQQERVDKLTRDLEETRNQLTQVNADQKRLTETIKEMERQARQEGFPARRAEIEKQARLLNIELEPFSVRETRLRDRESMLLGQLGYEQAKLNELNGKLDELEREFDAQAATEKPAPAPAKKR